MPWGHCPGSEGPRSETRLDMQSQSATPVNLIQLPKLFLTNPHSLPCARQMTYTRLHEAITCLPTGSIDPPAWGPGKRAKKGQSAREGAEKVVFSALPMLWLPALCSGGLCSQGKRSTWGHFSQQVRPGMAPTLAVQDCPFISHGKGIGLQLHMNILPGVSWT